MKYFDREMLRRVAQLGNEIRSLFGNEARVAIVYSIPAPDHPDIETPMGTFMAREYGSFAPYPNESQVELLEGALAGLRQGGVEPDFRINPSDERKGD